MALNICNTRQVASADFSKSKTNLWHTSIAIIVAVTVARLVYMIWLSPYELAGDEGYYWQQARHLDLCYNEKGPALAWMIAAAMKLFGDAEWVIRLPMVVSFALAAWGIGRLTMALTGGNTRAGFWAVICFCLMPAFQANAQICTQDGPLTALWVALSAIGLRLIRRWRGGQGVWGEWLLFWAVMGISVLFKQSVLLFFIGMAIYWLIERKSLRLTPSFLAQQAMGLAIFVVIISPMIIWNAKHGWPMMAHTLGHLGAGGDQAGMTNHGNALLWLGATVGGILGAFGPPAVILMGWGSWLVLRSSDRNSEQFRERFWLLCCAWPSVLFFVVLSFVKPVVPSWPLPSFVPLVAIVAEMAVVEFPRYAQKVAAWRKSTAGRKPETLFHSTFVFMAGYGLFGWLLICFPNVLTHLPLVGAKLNHSVLSRITGHRAEAARLETALASVATIDGQPPVIVTRHYMLACLDSYYLPGHPVLHTAGKYLAKRSTTFDQWDDTRLDNPALYGRTLLLISDGDVPWEKGLKFGKRTRVSKDFSLAENYQGPRADYPREGTVDTHRAKSAGDSE